MPRIKWTNPALIQLDDALAYVAQDNKRAAGKMGRRIMAAVKQLQRFPGLGRIGRAENTRELVIVGTPYIAVYRTGEIVEILALMHGARDWPDGF